jgi:phosphopantothenoylcysteine decarboxylase/phosphopantothenate--cysteine ligase
MYTAVGDNIKKVKDEGIVLVEPKKEEGKAKFPNINDITLQCLRETSDGKLTGKRVIVSGGGTYEEIDSIRGITNRSSGKMGLEIAKEAFIQGADVTFVTGRVEIHIPKLFKRVRVESTEEMRNELVKLLPENDVFVSAAAVSDFTVERISGVSRDKISSEEDFNLHLTPVSKIINIVKDINPEIFLVGFKAEYNVSEDELISSARKRMKTSKADLMVANDVSSVDAGFGSDKNQVLLVDDRSIAVPLTSKTEIARKIISKIVEKME